MGLVSKYVMGNCVLKGKQNLGPRYANFTLRSSLYSIRNFDSVPEQAVAWNSHGFTGLLRRLSRLRLDGLKRQKIDREKVFLESF